MSCTAVIVELPMNGLIRDQCSMDPTMAAGGFVLRIEPLSDLGERPVKRRAWHAGCALRPVSYFPHPLRESG